MIRAILYPIHRKKLNKASSEGKLYQIFVEKDAEFKPSQYNNFFDSLYTIYNKRDPHKWVSFEFHGTTRGIGLYTWLCGGLSKEFIQSNINSVHPAAEVVSIEDTQPKQQDYASFGRLYGKDVRCATLELDGHYLFNLTQSDGERVGADMMASLCASMQNLEDGEQVSVQFLLRPVHFRSLAIAQNHYELYKRFGRRPSKLRYPYAKYSPFLEFPRAMVGALKHAAMGSAGQQEVHTSTTSIQRKLEAGVYFDLLIRIVTVHPQLGRATERMDTVLSAFAPATDKNRLRAYSNYFDREKKWKGFTYYKNTDRTKFLQDYAARRIHTYPIENYVTPPELATMLHFPSKHIPNVIRLRAKKLPVPDGVYQYNSIEDAWADDAIVFGRSNFRGRVKYLAFKDIKMLMQHVYCIGGTGSGKSYWLSFIALQVVRQAGITFFDVKGDVVDDLMRHLPKSEWHRVVYIDLQEDMRFLPFNILKQEGMTVYNLATMIVSVFVKVFSEGSIKEHSQNVLRQALIAVISTDREGTLLEVYRMFTDENYLDLTIARLAEKNEYPDVLNYWKNIFKNMKASARKSECGAIVNKLQLITQNERPRYTLCQKDNVLKWRKMMDEKAIILVNLSLGNNEDQILQFFGVMFTSFISKATFSRDDTPRDQRVPHIFFLDEFEVFIDSSGDLKRFLELSRSYGLGLSLAHQSVKQIPSELLDIVKDNTFSQISLLIGEGSSGTVSKMFPSTQADDFTSMEEYTGFGRFRKLSPHTFTFDSIDMSEVYPSVSWEEVTEWKERYKRKHYHHMLSIKDEIDARYRLIEANQVQDSDSPRVQKNKASGRLGKKEKVQK